MRTRMAVMTLMAVGFVAISVGALRAQAPAQTATQFYMAYRAAFDKATKIEDLLPFMSAAQRKEINATPANKRAEGFEMIKMMGSMVTDQKVTKEEKAGTGATLTVEGVDGDKKKMTGKIKIVREANAWKLGEESWSN
jgi:hypothetical protein